MTDRSPVWFITGASSGLGRALAEAVLERKGQAVLTARTPEMLADLVKDHGDRAVALRLDITDDAAIDRAVREAETRFGRIDVLVNNAATAILQPSRRGRRRHPRAVRNECLRADRSHQACTSRHAHSPPW